MSFTDTNYYGPYCKINLCARMVVLPESENEPVFVLKPQYNE